MEPNEPPVAGPTKKRKPGAQPGNQNRLKHGFYARIFNRAETADLDEQHETHQKDWAGLTGEIDMLRVVMRRVFEQANLEAADLDAWTLTVSILGQATTRLGYLLRTQQKLKQLNNDEVVSLSKAISEVFREQGFLI
jgi:hypothetical protein